MTEEELATFELRQDREEAPLVWQFKEGCDLVAPRQDPKLQPRMRQLHDWYRQQSGVMFGQDIRVDIFT